MQTWTCDGERDCPNGADEENCSSANQTATASGDGNEGQSTQLPPPVFPTQNCQDHYMFKCVSNGQCIPYWWKCDQSSDCPDASDELECGQVRSYISKVAIIPIYHSKKVLKHVYRCVMTLDFASQIIEFVIKK